MMHYLINQLRYKIRDKRSSGSFCRDSTATSVLQTSPFHLFSKFVVGIWLDKCTRKAIPALRNIASSVAGDSTRRRLRDREVLLSKGTIDASLWTLLLSIA